MARKRPAKRRKGATHSYAPSPDVDPPADVTERSATATQHSSDDGTNMSEERPMSSAARTPMTSVADTDDEEVLPDEPAINTATTSEPDSDYDDAPTFAPSTYPRSVYPQPAAQHRTERPFLEPDMAYDCSDRAASTRSLWEQDLDYHEIHGRRYCRNYFMPNDEQEQARLYLLHQVFLHVFDGELTTVPLEDPKYILDIGTGVGEWAIAMSELYPNCEVVGTDISAIAETQSVPPNVYFEIDDAEDWDRSPDFYDLIHLRYMEGAFTEWSRVYDNVYSSLKPGGWIEVQDFDFGAGLAPFISSFAPESKLHVLHRDFQTASERARGGRNMAIQHIDKQLFMDAGFEEVRTSECTIPIAPNDPVSTTWLIAMVDAVEATYLRYLTEYMGWDPQELKSACESAAKDLVRLARDPEKSKGMYVKLVSCRGRKPIDAPLAPGTPQQLPSTYPPSFVTTEGSPTDEKEQFSPLSPAGPSGGETVREASTVSASS